MTDNKQQPQFAYGAPPPAGFAVPPGQAPYPATAGFGTPGFGAPGQFPQTGFAGPGYVQQPAAAGYPPQGYEAGFSNQGYGMGPGMGVGPNPHMGFNIPNDDGPKPYSNESGSSYGDIHGFDFSEKTIRMAFIRKVYGILGIQLSLTTGLIALFTLHEGVKLWTRQNPAFTIVSYIIAIVLMFAIVCCESARRKSPQNLILLGLFTLTYGTVIGVIASTYNAQSVVVAAGITVVVCLALTAFSFQTKYDFTAMGGALFVCLIVLTLFGFVAIFVRLPIIQLVLAAAGALLFSVYLVYDTQLMMGGKHKMSISPEEYIFASLNLYIDVIMIFLYLLRLFGSRD